MWRATVGVQRNSPSNWYRSSAPLLKRKVEQGNLAHHAGIVDQDVEVTELFDRLAMKVTAASSRTSPQTSDGRLAPESHRCRGAVGHR